MSARKTILIVDDDANILKAIEVRLKSAGYEVLTAHNGADAVTIVEMKKLDLIIADIWMPIGMGFSLAYRLNQLTPKIPIIFLTASKQPGLRQTAREFGVDAFLEKPYEPEALLAAITEVLDSQASAGRRVRQRPDRTMEQS